MAPARQCVPSPGRGARGSVPNPERAHAADPGSAIGCAAIHSHARATWRPCGSPLAEPTAALAQPTLKTRLARSYALAPGETVFAYSRICPDGALLAYSSEQTRDGKVERNVTVVDLAAHRVVFTEPGLDSYWSPDGMRLVYLSTRGTPEACIWDRASGEVHRAVAPQELGAYYTWGRAEGRDLILTQRNYYFLLGADKGQRPFRTVPPCPGVGRGEQPMLSHDGKLIATFVRGSLAVRSLDTCERVLETHLPGGKGDFSFDGRYLAFHMPKQGGQVPGYAIVVVDLDKRRLVHVTDLPGSSYYPSWTRDGRLSFRYDGEDFRGFLLASDFLGNAWEPLPTSAPKAASAPTLQEVLGGQAPAAARAVLINFWAPWCSHCRDELPALARLDAALRAARSDVVILGACAPDGRREDRERLIRSEGLGFRQVDLSPQTFADLGVRMFPTSMLFVDGRLVERRFGSQRYDDFVAWLRGHGVTLRP